MRTLLLMAALTVAAGQSRAAEDDIKKELKKFEGTWVLVSGEKEGVKLPDEHVKNSKIVIRGNEAHVVTPHQSKEPIKATLKVNPAKEPRHMEWTRSSEPHKGKVMLAIYEFISDDQYRICFAPPGKERPKEFKTKADSGHILHVWKRVKE